MIRLHKVKVKLKRENRVNTAKAFKLQCLMQLNAQQVETNKERQMYIYPEKTLTSLCVTNATRVAFQ